MIKKNAEYDIFRLFDRHLIVRRFIIIVGLLFFFISIFGYLISCFLFVFRGGGAEVFAFPVLAFFASYLFFFLSFLFLDLNVSVNSDELFLGFDRIFFWRFGFVNPFKGWFVKPLVCTQDKAFSIILRCYYGDEIIAVFFVTLFFVLSFFFDSDAVVKRYSVGGGVFLCFLLLMAIYCAASSGLVVLLRIYCKIVSIKTKYCSF